MMALKNTGSKCTRVVNRNFPDFQEKKLQLNVYFPEMMWYKN